MSRLSRLRYGVSLFVGRMLNTLRWHEVSHVSVESCHFVSKRRRWLARCVIPLANLVLRFEQAGVRVLADPAWKQREIDLHRQQGAALPRRGPRGALWLPRRTGRSLAEWLSDPNLPSGRKLDFVAAAACALAELHTFREECCAEHVTHGDATTRNVMVDPDTGIAVWIDFDTAHCGSERGDWRRTDDLRALICSAATSIPEDGYEELVRAIAIGYGLTAKLGELGQMLARVRRRPRLFHVAQAPLEWSRLSRLRDEVVRVAEDGLAENHAADSSGINPRNRDHSPRLPS